ncbi:MAG TPA: Obg family GTPase CgtA, partial [Acidimicrobiales bacterium]
RQFLRHVERARVLVVMVDLAPSAMHSPAQQREILLRELTDYDPVLLTRPRIEVGSRADLDDGTWDWDGERVTAVTGEGVPQLVGRMVQAVTDARAEMPAREAYVVHRLEGEGYQVVRDETGTGWDVLGREAIRAVRLSDLTNPEALDEAHRRLKTLGIDRALARAGAKPGDTVRIGKLEFDYEVE